MTAPIRTGLPGGRSSLLRAGQPSPSRQRPYLRRRLVIAGLTTTVVLTCVATSRVWFSTTGVGRPLYWIHDTIWLPSYSNVWTEPFPWGLMWLVPLSVVLLSVLLEFAGFVPLLRRAQIWVLRALINRRFRSLITAGACFRRAFGAPSGLAVAIVEDDLTSILHHMLCARDTDTSGQLAQSCYLHDLALDLKPDSLSLVMSALEVLALCKLANRLDTEPAKILQKRLLVQSDTLEFMPDAIAALHTPPDVETVLEKATRLSVEDSSGVELAFECLSVSLGAVSCAQPGCRVWFDCWAQFRIGADPELSRKLADAETMIAFEFWSALCETVTGGAPVSDVLLHAFQDVGRERPRGELFASPYEQESWINLEERG